MALCVFQIRAGAEADNDLQFAATRLESNIDIEAMVFRSPSDKVSNCTPVVSLDCAVVEECTKGDSFKVKRIISGNEAYIAACLYPAADNTLSGPIGTTKYRWVNWSTGTDKVEVFIYNCTSDALDRYGYTSKANYDADKDSQGNLSLTHTDRSQHYFPPPTDPDAFSPWYGALSNKPTNDSLLKLQQGKTQLKGIYHTLAAEVACLLKNGKEWHYGLVVCAWEKTIVNPGDTLTFEGSGIIGGSISGNAGSAAFGGWRVKSAGAGKVVFEATCNALLGNLVDAFVVLGRSTEQSNLTYKSLGNCITCFGSVAGPASGSSKGLPWIGLLLLN